MLNQPRIRFALAIVIIAALGGTVYAAIHDRVAAPETPITITSPVATTSAPAIAAASESTALAANPGATTTDAGSTIEIHITGAVKTPNLYVLPVGARLNDAIKAAGGSLGDADLNAVNLAEKLQDGEKVYVPTHSDTRSISPMTDAAPQNSIADKPAETVTVADATPESSMSDSTDTSTSTTTSPAPKASKSKGSSSKSNKLTDPSQGTININTADAEQLMRLPGVGKTTAAKIIAYRTANGPFKSVDDLTSVGGIGQKKLAKLRPFVRLN